MPRFKDRSAIGSILIEEYHKPGGHPCAPYYDYLKKIEAEKLRKYDDILDTLSGRKERLENEDNEDEEEQTIDSERTEIPMIEHEDGMTIQIAKTTLLLTFSLLLILFAAYLSTLGNNLQAALIALLGLSVLYVVLSRD